MAKVNANIEFENVRIGFRNFSGNESRFNPAGRRNFCVFIDDEEFAKRLEGDGWNVRYLAARNEEETEQAYMNVSVSYDPYPPQIVVVTKTRKTVLTEDMVGMLDWAEIVSVDLIVRPYNWEVNGRSGVKAYCKSMYVTIEEDKFAEKYEDIPYEEDSSPVNYGE